MEEDARYTPQSKRNAFRSVLIGISIIALVALALSFLFTPTVIRSISTSRAAEAMIKMKKIKTSLDSYAKQYSHFPDSAHSSNEVFRELFRKDICKDEKIFFSNYPSSHQATEGDNNTAEGYILEQGTNGFSYWTHANDKGFVPEKVPAKTPLLSSPMLKQDSLVKFQDSIYEPFCFGGLATVIYADGSSRIFNLDGEGRLMDDNGQALKQETISTRVVFPEGSVGTLQQ